MSRVPDTALIDEVRATRHRIAAEYGYDLMKITEHAEKAAKELGRSAGATGILPVACRRIAACRYLRSSPRMTKRLVDAVYRPKLGR